MDIWNQYNENNFSAWGGGSTPPPKEEPEEEYVPTTRTGKINQVLDEYLKRKANLDKIKGKKRNIEIELLLPIFSFTNCKANTSARYIRSSELRAF